MGSALGLLFPSLTNNLIYVHFTAYSRRYHKNRGLRHQGDSRLGRSDYACVGEYYC